jgi:ribosome recycling factor
MTTNPALKDVHNELKTRMEKAVAGFKQVLASTRTGRASAAMLEHVRVDYYGTLTALHQMAQITVPEAHQIVIQPWDTSVIAEIEKTLRTAEYGFNPQNDGKLIRVPIPPMTEERRRDVVKQLSKSLEDHRTGIRGIRRDGNEALKKLAKDKKISEDDEKRAMEEIQKLTDDEIRHIEELFRKKEVEVMQV